MGDACYEPAAAVYSLVNSQTIQDVIRHYLTCSVQNGTTTSDSTPLGSVGTFITNTLDVVATNPLYNYLNQSYSYLELANQTFAAAIPGATSYLRAASLSTDCIIDINTQIQRLADFLNRAFDKIQCLPLARVWIVGVNNGICTDGFRGLTNVWIVLLLNGLFLFGAMVSATIFMPMFMEREPVDVDVDVEGSMKEQEGGDGGDIAENNVEEGVNAGVEVNEDEQETQEEIEMTEINMNRHNAHNNDSQDSNNKPNTDDVLSHQIERSEGGEEEAESFGMSHVT